MAGVNKAQLTETDIINKFILPAVKEAGWDDMTQIRREVKLRDGKPSSTWRMLSLMQL